MKKLLKMVMTALTPSGHVRFIQAPLQTDARLAGDYADKSWLRQPADWQRRVDAARERLGDKYACAVARDCLGQELPPAQHPFRYTPAAFMVPNQSARRSAF